MKTYIEVPKILIVVQGIANHKTIGYLKADIWKQFIEKMNVSWKCFLIILIVNKAVTYSYILKQFIGYLQSGTQAKLCWTLFTSNLGKTKVDIIQHHQLLTAY